MATLEDILEGQQSGPASTQQGGDAVSTATATAANGTTPVATENATAPAEVVDGGTAVQTQTGAPSSVVTPPQQPEDGAELQRILVSMGYNAPETPEEKAKREKNEKWEKIFSAIGDGVSAMAGLYFAGQTGISNYSKENSMSAKTKARWDKLNAERQANAKAYGDAYFRLRGLQGQEQHWRDQMQMQREQFAWQQEQAKQQQANWQATFDYNKEKDDKAWERLLANDAQAQENWQKTFDAQQEQIKFQNEMARKQYNLSRRSLARQSSGDNVDFLIGNNEKITVPKSSLNAANITYVYRTLPQSVRDQYHGTPVMNKVSGMQAIDATGQPMYNQLTSDEMLTIIFSNVTTSTETQNALRQLSGQTTGNTRRPNPMGN